MIPTFTGSGKRARNINLSGRPVANPFAQKTSNPFAGTSSTAPGSQSAIAVAQQERIARQKERERVQGAIRIQKSWRSYAARRKKREERRREWDSEEASAESGDVAMTQEEEGGSRPPPYKHEIEAGMQTEGLIEFFEAKKSQDLDRLKRWLDRMDGLLGGDGTWPAYEASYDAAYSTRERRAGLGDFAENLPAALLYLQRRCLTHLTKNLESQTRQSANELLTLVTRMQLCAPQTSALAISQFYRALALLSHKFELVVAFMVELLSRFRDKFIYAARQLVYEAMARHILVLPLHKLPSQQLRVLGLMMGCVPTSIFTDSFLSRQSPSWYSSEGNAQQRLNLLTNLIYCYRTNHGPDQDEPFQSSYIAAVGRLLSSLVDSVQVESTALSDNDKQGSSSSIGLNDFQREQLYSLIEQRSFRVVVDQIDPDDLRSSVSRRLASYILILLRMFPRRGDEIRMWLYLGMSSDTSKVDVITYFWRAAMKTQIFDLVSSNAGCAISLLKPYAASPGAQGKTQTQIADTQLQIDDEWRLVLILIELYTFVLKVMDDEEFFSNSSQSSIYGSTGQKNSLTLNDLQLLSTFLKHLGFTMYYHVALIIDDPAEQTDFDLGSLFRISQNAGSGRQDTPTKRPPAPTYIAGVQGMTIDYVKGLVTGLLRAIYERDSRRPFMPKSHWLMTSQFDMTNFIDAVVDEEDRRTKVQEQDDEDQSEDEEEDLVDTPSRVGLVGTSHVQRTRRIEQLSRQQRKASRHRYLQAVAPKLEILQNMPFIIPFTMRVQIFRRFVYLDQFKARGGVDPDIMAMINPGAGRHQAKIRREHEFQDAYEQFYDLGAALKQPISISFVDRFDTVEAGIDGGGVTKEFLTSVTGEAFRPTNTEGIRMFAENDQHLLYPNPSALDEQKELLREAGIREGSDDWRLAVQDLLQKYEFLGRIIGKCLYENILVDVGFASFFLLKWALTGGAGQAPKESGYRATLNDLRDFDEGLYQGLLKLKNHPGDVSDFGLTFTVTDTLSLPSTSRGHKTKTIERELQPGGSAVPVTNTNRLVYISYMARHRLTQQPYAQTTAFLRGLSAIISPTWLRMFNQLELQTLVGGTVASGINIADLRANTVYGGVYSIGDDGLEHPSVQMFWEVMEELNEEDKGKVLKFVTSTPRAPLLGWGSLVPRFSIRDAGDDETRLPSTSTCVNLLKMPRYRSKEGLKRKLMVAVNSGAGFDLS